MSDYYIQLPPDSTGKKSTMIAVVTLSYTGHAPQTMSIGDEIAGLTSGAAGAIARVVPNDGDVTQGFIEIVMDIDSPTIIFTDSENLQIQGSTVAQASGTGDPVYTQKTSISGGNNPFNQAFVDEQGALFVRNAEGSPQFDAFGLSRGSQPTILSDYRFNYGEFTQWQVTTSGTGAAGYLANENSLGLNISAASGDSCAVRTHNYHPYQPGLGQIINMTISNSDVDKPGRVARWGYYDDDDGLYFEIDEDNGFYVVLRSSVTGSIVNTRVHQDKWNGDKVNGVGGVQNLSRFNLEADKMNIYWIDLAWLGAGKVRFGVYDSNGGRIVCHTFENPGASVSPYMRTGSLPVTAELSNNALTSGPSVLKMTCAVVLTDGRLIPDKSRKSTKRCYVADNLGSITSEVPIVSIRAKSSYNGFTNRKITLPEIFSFHVRDQPVIIRVKREGTLTGESWFSPTTDTTVEIDDSATAIADGSGLFCWMLEPGTHNLKAPENFSIQGEKIHTQADGSAGYVYTVTVESLTTAAQVRVALTWIDLD